LPLAGKPEGATPTATEVKAKAAKALSSHIMNEERNSDEAER
jgi:hypothetical protein